MTREQVLKFISWLKEHDIFLAGQVYQPLLGVYRPMPLAEEDYDEMIADFVKDCKA